jgi:hypothetical protein
MFGYTKLVRKLEGVSNLGFIKTHRTGNTGIGKTLEDLLGITENNIPGPNAKMIELKSARKNAKSMLTLFTKSPLPEKANSILLQKFGYKSKRGNKRKELHTTVNAISYNQLKGKYGFKIGFKKDCVILLDEQKNVLGYWDKETLKNSFERKLPKLMYVKAETKNKGPNEEFWFNEAWLLSGFDFDNFLKLLKEGIILVDIRIGQYHNGKPHDHGTGFRILPDKLDFCFSHRKRII